MVPYLYFLFRLAPLMHLPFCFCMQLITMSRHFYILNYPLFPNTNQSLSSLDWSTVVTSIPSPVPSLQSVISLGISTEP